MRKLRCNFRFDGDGLQVGLTFNVAPKLMDKSLNSWDVKVKCMVVLFWEKG